MNALSTTREWEQFLKAFATALGAADWPGNPAASHDRLLKAEGRLKIKLPPSYRAFLGASNGWRNASREVPELRPVEKIRWFKRECPEWVQANSDSALGALLPAESDYFDYTREDSDSVDFDPKHLAHTLCISEIGDSAVLLLNPMVVWPDGEWEAWLFADWIPGAIRYRSFADWMRHELAGLQGEVFTHSTVPGELPTVYLDGPAKPNRRIRAPEEVLTFEQALKRIGSKTRARRVKGIRQLCRADRQRAVPVLFTLLKAGEEEDFHVRCEAAEMLGRMRVNEAVEPLIVATGGDRYISSAAAQALGYFNDDVSAQHLLKLVDEGGSLTGVASHAMARRNDPRAIPLLVRKLLSKDPPDLHVESQHLGNQHWGSIAGTFIAEFGEAGYLALESLAGHEDLEVRSRAFAGIDHLALLAKDKQVKTQALNLLEAQSKKEPDAEFRRHLEIWFKIASNKKVTWDDNPFAVTEP